MPTPSAEAVKKYGLVFWFAVPVTIEPSRNVAVPVIGLKAVPVSDTVRVSCTGVPRGIVDGDVVLNTEFVEETPPSRTATLLLPKLAVARPWTPFPPKSATTIETGPDPAASGLGGAEMNPRE